MTLVPRDVSAILRRALEDEERGVGGQGLAIDDDALAHLVGSADGDARAALNFLEVAAAQALAEAGELRGGTASPEASGGRRDSSPCSCLAMVSE